MKGVTPILDGTGSRFLCCWNTVFIYRRTMQMTGTNMQQIENKKKTKKNKKTARSRVESQRMYKFTITKIAIISANNYFFSFLNFFFNICL